MSEIVIVGLNHRTAPVEVRERLAFPADTVGHALRGLRERDGIAEGVILSTCNRVEVCVLSDEGYKGVEHVKDFLAEFHGVPIGALSDHLYHHLGEEAVRHLFRVSSSLDSMVLGEPQILGQVKDAYGYACEFKSIGPVLDKFFTKAFSVAKRVRTETRVANSAVSVSYAAVELAKKILGDLTDKVVMLIGAGEMCELAARHLLSAGARGILVTNRTFERAVLLAEEFEGTPVRFEELLGAIRRVLAGRKSKPPFVVTKRGVFRIIPEAKSVWIGGTLISNLAPKRFAVLFHLLQSEGEVPWEDLLLKVWGRDGAKNDLEKTVQRLREDLGAEGRRLQTTAEGYEIVG